MTIEYLLCTHVLLCYTVLIMREKVISAMMVQVKETDTKQRIDSVLEEKTHSDSGTEPVSGIATMHSVLKPVNCVYSLRSTAV